MRMHRHAIESICGMLDLRDLNRALAVSRSWSAAVRSMAPIRASIQRDWQSKTYRPLPSIRCIVGSPLLRHIASIASIQIRLRKLSGGTSWNPLDSASLILLAQHAPNLTSLRCNFMLTLNELLILPPKLKDLHLRLEDEYTDAAINGMLTAVAALPSLSVLCLNLFSFKHENNVQLSLLAASGSLTDLTLATLVAYLPQLSNAQVDQIVRLSDICNASTSMG